MQIGLTKCEVLEYASRYPSKNDDDNLAECLKAAATADMDRSPGLSRTAASARSTRKGAAFATAAPPVVNRGTYRTSSFAFEAVPVAGEDGSHVHIVGRSP